MIHFKKFLSATTVAAMLLTTLPTYAYKKDLSSAAAEGDMQRAQGILTQKTGKLLAVVIGSHPSMDTEKLTAVKALSQSSFNEAGDYLTVQEVKIKPGNKDVKTLTVKGVLSQDESNDFGFILSMEGLLNGRIQGSIKAAEGTRGVLSCLRQFCPSVSNSHVFSAINLPIQRATAALEAGTAPQEEAAAAAAPGIGSRYFLEARTLCDAARMNIAELQDIEDMSDGIEDRLKLKSARDTLELMILKLTLLTDEKRFSESQHGLDIEKIEWLTRELQQARYLEQTAREALTISNRTYSVMKTERDEFEKKAGQIPALESGFSNNLARVVKKYDKISLQNKTLQEQMRTALEESQQKDLEIAMLKAQLAELSTRAPDADEV
jgi:hypothetical protein